MPNPDITTGSAVGGGGRVPGRPHKPKPKVKPAAIGRPAPRDRNKPSKTGPIKVVVPKILHPIDEVALRRQRLMRTLGHPVTVDGIWGRRSRAAWNQVGLPEDGYDRARSIDRLAAVGNAQMQGVRQQAANGIADSDTQAHLLNEKTRSAQLNDIYQLIKQKTPGALAAAQALAEQSGVLRPGMTLRKALQHSAFEEFQAEMTRALKARVDKATLGLFHDTLTPDQLARLHGVEGFGEGLQSLSGNDLAWLLQNDGVTLKQRFTVTKPSKDGVARVPTQEFTKVLQGYANRMGVRIAGRPVLEDGNFDARTADALIAAAHIEQHRQEMIGYHKLKEKFVKTGVWAKAQRSTGMDMDFTTAWRQARSRKAGWEAQALLAAAALQAKEDYPDYLYAQQRLDAFDAAQLFGHGGLPKKGAKGPFAGTPYGLMPDAPALLALASGVPQTIALSETRQEFEVYTSYLQQLAVEQAGMEETIRGTAENDTIEYLVRRQTVPVLNGDGTPKMERVAGPRGGVSVMVPVTETRVWTDPNSAYIKVHKSAQQDFSAAVENDDFLGALTSIVPASFEQSMTHGNIPGLDMPVLPAVFEGAHQAGRPAEWVTLQAVAATMEARDIFIALARTDVQRSIQGGWTAGTMSNHDYDREARIWFEEQGFWTQMALTAVFDPLNFVGKGFKGVAILGREMERFIPKRGFAAELPERALATHGPSIIAEDDLVASNRAITASLTGGDLPSPMRAQAKPLQLIRRAVNEQRDLLRAIGFKGARGVKPEVLAEEGRWYQAAEAGMRADPSSMHGVKLAEEHGMSWFEDESMNQMSDVGLAEYASRMVAVRPAMLRLLKQAKFSEDLVRTIDDHVFGMIEGSLPAPIAFHVERIEREFDDAIRDSMTVLERGIRTRNGYKFEEDPLFQFVDGRPQKTYRGPRLVDTAPVSRYYRELQRLHRGGAGDQVIIEARNPGYALPQTAEEMEISVNREVRRRVRDRMRYERDEYRRTGRQEDEEELRIIAETHEARIRREVQSYWTPGGGKTRAEQAEAQAVLDTRHDLAMAAKEQSKRNRDAIIAERTRQAQVLANLIQSEGLSGKLANALAQLGLKGRLEHAADEAVDDTLERQGATADEALIIRARRQIEEHVGSFDPRMATNTFNTEEMVSRLEEVSGSILRSLNDGQIPDAFNAEMWREALLRYADAEHPSMRIKWYEFGPGKKGGPHARRYKKGTSEIKTWKPENAVTAATFLHEVAHTMAMGIEAGLTREGGKLDDELITSLIAIRLRKELFPNLDADAVAMFDARLAKAFAHYYYAEAESTAAARMFEISEQGIAGFSADEVKPFLQTIADMDTDMPVVEPEALSFEAKPGDEGYDAQQAQNRAKLQAARDEQRTLRQAKAKEATRQVLQDAYDREQAIKQGLLGEAVEGDKDLAAPMRDVLAQAMTGGLARRGLALSEDNVDSFFHAVRREGLDVRMPDAFKRLVGNLPYRHPDVESAFQQLQEADELATRAFKTYFEAREGRFVDHTSIGLLKEESQAATDNYWKASDRVFSRLLRLMDPHYLERMALEMEGEQLRLSKLAKPTYEQRMVATIHRASAKSLRGYLAAGDASRGQISEVNRAVTSLHRELVGLNRQVRQHHEAYLSASRTEQGLRQRMREMGSAPAGTFFDSRPTIRIEQDPEVGTRSENVGKINDARDGVAWAEGERMATEPRRTTVELTSPANQNDKLYVRAGDFAIDERGVHTHEGQLYEEFIKDPDTGKPKRQALPLDAVSLADLTEGQLQTLFESGRISPADTLKAGPKRAFFGDETRTAPAAYVEIPKYVKGKTRMVRVSTENLRRGVPPQIGDEIRAELRRQIEAGATLDTLDTTIVEQLAKDNPLYADSIHLFAHRQTVGMAMRGWKHASNVADKQAMSSLLAERGLYISALSFHTSRSARYTYKALNVSLQVWKFAALPFSMTWLLANVVDNFAKRLISGLVDPKEMALAPLRTGARATGTLSKFAVHAVYQAAREGDRMFNTHVADQLDGILRAVTHYDANVRNTFLRAHHIDVPGEIAEGGYGVFMASPLDTANRRWDPLDWKGPWKSVKEGNKRDLPAAFAATMWHLVGDLPETAARRAAYNVAYRKAIKEGLSVDQAVEKAIGRVNATLFDYNDITVGEENLRLLLPFVVYWRKNLGYWMREVPQHPWIVSNLQRLEEYRSDPMLEEGKDPLARYFDVTGVVDDVLGHLGIDVPDGVAWDPVKLFSIRVVYELMFSSQNPNMPPDQGGIEVVNRILGYFDDIGLGVNPYLRAGLQAFDVYEAQSWRSIFPETGLVEGLSREWWHERFPNGINIERFLLDPLYEPFHDGQSLSDLREADINYYVQVEMSRQAMAGKQPNRAEAEDSVRGFFGVAALVQMTAGVYLRRMNGQDRELLRLRQMARTDFNSLTPHQMAVNTVDRERFKTSEMMDRAVEAYPMIEVYYRTSDYRERQQLLQLYPEISPYVQRTKARQQFANPLLDSARRQRLKRDTLLANQRGLVAQIYNDMKSSSFDSDQRSRVYGAMVTPDLRRYMTEHQTSRSQADAFVRGEYYSFVNKVSQAFHDIPEDDYARRSEFIARNPYLQDYWTLTATPEKDGVSIVNAANAAYRSWYFAVVESEGWDAAAEILEAHPQMFDLTKAAGRVDRATGKWQPKTMADIKRHASDYARMKPQLDEYFNQPKGAARAHWLEGHPEVLRYFKVYGADRHYRRRHYRRYAFAHASAPWASRRAEFWHRFFQLPPDQRVKFIEQHAAEYDVFAWGPTADSQLTANAHAFAWGDTPRKEAYKQIAALMQVYFELDPEDRQFFLSANPEIQDYFDQFSTKSPTGDPKLDKVLETYFDTPHDLQPAYLDKHPELKAYFQTKRDTPEEKAIGVLLDAYFGLPKARRPDYLMSHPELQGFFDERKQQQDMIDAYDEALTEADPRYKRYKGSEEYLRARAEIHLRRASLMAGTVNRQTTKLSTRTERSVDDSLVRGPRQPTS
jgi:hypothetical protein